MYGLLSRWFCSRAIAMILSRLGNLLKPVVQFLTHHQLLVFRDLFVAENIHAPADGSLSVSLSALQRFGYSDNLILRLKTNAGVSAPSGQDATYFCPFTLSRLANITFHIILGRY